MKAGIFVATTFFVLLTVAAWTAAIGLLEPAVAWLSETRGMARPTAAMRVGFVVWLLGFLTVFSFNVLKNVHFWRGRCANLDYLAINIPLPLSGLHHAVRGLGVPQLERRARWRNGFDLPPVAILTPFRRAHRRRVAADQRAGTQLPRR
jgi:SNF family Na+-dependent transporter